MAIRQGIPNLLTILRFVLAPAAILLLAIKKDLTAAGIIFLVCCLTDFLDGFLARSWHAQSSFGKTFDPIADKVLIVGILIVLLFQRRVIGFVGLTLVARDLIMDCLRLCLWRFNRIIPAIKTAKVKTICQMIGIALILLCFQSDTSQGFFPTDPKVYLHQIPLLLAMFFSLWSFGVYMYRINKNR